MEPGDRALDNPAVNAEAGTVRNAATGDDRFDALSPDRASVLVVVVATVTEQDVGQPPWPPHETRDRWDSRQQGVLPLDPGMRHEQDPEQSLPARHPRSAAH
ncbi:hypothetical protein QR77_32835 [Streptomyces sp. 150FB]|nr:hypothetical protein QR77_32835 [Streptomyces sp. 150FB]